MTFWPTAFRPEGSGRDASLYWDEDQAEPSSNFFNQYVDFDNETASTTATAGFNDNPPMPTMRESILFDQRHDGTGSSGVSTADDFDFLSNSSQAGPGISATGHDVDPISLAVKAENQVASSQHYEAMDYGGECAVSDTELPPLGDISLQSPKKEVISTFHDHSPSPPRTTTQGKTSRFVEALSSTIRKATTRKSRRPLPVHQPRADSPTLDQPPRALRPQNAVQAAAPLGVMPVSPPEPGFIHGYCEDPFVEIPPPPPQSSPMRYYSQNGLSTPADTPALGMIQNEPMNMPTQMPAAQMPTTTWPVQQMVLAPAPEQWTGGDFIPNHDIGWWNYNLMSQQAGFEDPNRHVGVHNAAQVQQQASISQGYPPLADHSPGGLGIHMPQPGAPQHAVVGGIAVTAQTYLPPTRQAPASERSRRPGPRAPSSGARHRNLSSSPLRKTRAPRAPSASPTPNQNRKGSDCSMTSVRSASGRLPAAMPGTPCSIRKRKSREPSAGDGIHFVNFTSTDGKKIMTGVAPSGSSKTKARREKEAQEQSRRLSEAAMRLVEAAGGDVDMLAEHGFAF